jgi:maleate isomerase
MVYGSRGKIGIIHPAPGVAMETEIHKAAPEGVAVFTTRIPFVNATPEELGKLADHGIEASSLLAQAKPDLIDFVCTAGSFIRGIGYDQEIIRKIEKRTGIPATTTTTAVIDALNALKVKKIGLAAAYIDAVNQVEKAFLENSGFSVVSMKGLGRLGKMGYVEYDELTKLARDTFTDECEAIFISCTGLCTQPIIEPLEEELKRPVITSNQATIWQAFRKIKVNDKIKGFGQIFSL